MRFDRENPCKGITVQTEEKKRSVLIVDDEEAILFAFKDVLSEPWMSIDTAQSIEEARSLLLSTSYDGAIIDLRLGGSNGFEGFEAIRMVKERNPRCKVILLTAYARPGTRERALAEGADFFMEKPVSPEDIKRVLLSEGVM
jgi:CheY-like chemotaxis protein